MQITTVGLDIAKNLFQVHGADAQGRVLLKRKLARSKVLEFFATLPACLVGLEACGAAHYWARELTKLGHQVRLMPPQYVRPYVKTNKHDAADAEDGPATGILGSVATTVGISRADLLILLSFAAGMIPEVALRWLGGWVRRLFGQSGGSDELDLEAIEGIDAQTRVRLTEVGIYDAQGLVTTNPLHLTLKTPFSLPQIMDWVGQAFLFIQVKRGQLDALREAGVRTVWQLAARNGPTAIAGTTVEPQVLLATLQQDPGFVRAREVLDRMRGHPAATTS